MDLNSLTWVIIFAFLIVCINILYTLIVSYISNKPLGLQSLFDSVMRDHFRITQMTGTTLSLIAIITRFEALQQIIDQYKVNTITVKHVLMATSE